MLSRTHLHILHILNILSFISAFICTVYGSTIIPVSITNTTQGYIGDSHSYNEDLKQAQLHSYGFKLIIIGLSVCGGNILSLVLICCYTKYQDTYTENTLPAYHPQVYNSPVYPTPVYPVPVHPAPVYPAPVHPASVPNSPVHLIPLYPGRIHPVTMYHLNEKRKVKINTHVTEIPSDHISV